MVKTDEFSVKNYVSNPTGFYGNPPKVSDHSLKFIESLQKFLLVKQHFKTNNFAFIQKIHSLLANIPKLLLVFFRSGHGCRFPCDTYSIKRALCGNRKNFAIKKSIFILFGLLNNLRMK